jgi:uncharacterized protein YukE
MTSYEVSMEQMEFVRGEMQTVTDNLQATLDNLADNVTRNLAHWSADSREAYNVAKAKWDIAAQAMHYQLAQATKAVGIINEYYQSGEKYGTSLWDQYQ